MIRTRIALVFGAVFAVLGAALLIVVNLLSRAGTQTEAREIAATAVPLGPVFPARGVVAAEDAVAPIAVYRITDNVSEAAGHQMLIWSALALLVMAVCAVGVGWWTAGRLLRPVHAMTAKARRLGASTLHERIGAGGPDDELKELGDTFDGLLARLERAFDSQRRFIANASHELRTPLATQRTAIQVGLDDAEPAKQVLLETNRRSERLIEGLLVLAHSERGLADARDVDLAEIVREEAAARGDLKVTQGAQGTQGAGGSVVRGNALLLAQLAGNLLANAVTYNVPGGSVEVDVTGGVLTVTNSGPEIAAADVPGLFEPFRRGEGRDRMGPGAGLGLSIVRSIAAAHGGTATARPGPEGGLAVRVILPTVPATPAAPRGSR